MRPQRPFRQPGSAQGELADIVVLHGGGYLRRDSAAGQLSVIEEVHRRHAEKARQRHQVPVGRIVTAASAQLPQVGAGDDRLACPGVDRGGSISGRVRTAIGGMGRPEQVVQPGREQSRARAIVFCSCHCALLAVCRHPAAVALVFT